ncbi:MAG: NAD(P)-binding domain-containing protein, partial [Burkholderiaceae bacterium]|nr:NAD(P)-binding domain-containing protein [Burkholderiaceae bacterium]
MPPSPLPRIGFIGLGVMGAPMAGHLARAGYALTVLDADPLRTRMVAEACAGVRIAGTPREVGAASDIVITMLPNGRIVQQVTLGEDGLQAGMSAGSLLLDTSSSEPWLTRDTARTLAQSGIDLVDAPVSGAQWGAEAAELVFMVGAAPA